MARGGCGCRSALRARRAGRSHDSREGRALSAPAALEQVPNDPIGGVAAIDAEHGVISPAGIGSDMSCGMRLVNALASRVPAVFIAKPFSIGQLREAVNEVLARRSAR